MPTGDTIAACSTPPARSARAMVRVSGPGAAALANELGIPRRRGASRTVFQLPRAAGDGFVPLPALAIRYPAPASYTGEDVLELIVPGNPALVERLVNACTARPGFRAAEPGEFSARAYLNGRLTLDQAEGVAATIAAVSDEQLAAAAELLAGRAGAEYRAWADELTTLVALVEAGIDFTDQEDVRPIAPEVLAARLRRLRDSLGEHLASGRGREAPRDEPLVVLVGLPNAGKSTLFNALLGRRRALAAPSSGTTRDVLEEGLDLSDAAPGAGRICLADIAGLDSRATGVSALAQDAAREAVRRADVLVWCDPHAEFDLREIPPTEAPVLRVRTFADRERAEDVPGVIPVCGLDGWNLGELKRAIASAVRGVRASGVAALLPRHRRAMRSAMLAMEQAIGVISSPGGRLASPEVVAELLREALDHTGELAGRISPDDIIGRVFATFCVGK